MAEAKSSDGEQFQVWDVEKLCETWDQIRETHDFSSRLERTIEFDQPEFIRQRHLMDMKEFDLKKVLNPTCKSKAELTRFMVNAVNHLLKAKTFVSKTPLNELERTTIPELILEEAATGAYILARSLESWHKKHMAWNTVIEDHRGHVIDLSLYNFPVDELFLPGEVIIIKEPYLRLPRDEIPVIYSDCPTNIIVLRSFHSLCYLGREIEWQNYVKETKDLFSVVPRPSNASVWKEIGESFFYETNNMVTARDAFHLGIDACLMEQNNSMLKKLRLYIFDTQLRLEYFEWVVEHAGAFLQQFPEEKAAYLRLGTAYYGLRKYQEAMKAYENYYCEKFPGEEEGQEQLERAGERVRESKGEFDFDKLSEMSIKNPMEELDCADYSGCVEKMVKNSGKGRGLVSTKDLKKGELVMVSKALAAILDDKYIPIQENVRVKSEIVSKLSRVIVKNPNTFGPLVYGLYSNEKAREGAVAVFCDPDLKTEPISDVGLIENIYKCNCFRIINSSGKKDKRNGHGLFLCPSYFNHSYIPNLDCTFYNDIMVIRAAKDIKKGTELTVPYVLLKESFEKRQDRLRKRGFTFTCRCDKCKARM